jgi:ribonuclease-3 family protein
VISSQPEPFSDLPKEPVLLDAPLGSSTDIQRFTPAALAYLGDAVYELYVRRSYFAPPKRIDAYHRQVVAQVRAESQANHLRLLLPHLTEQEQDVVRRGRNAAAGRPKRLDPEVYQQATSLEVLVGYLYLTSPQRLLELLSYLQITG